MNIVFHHISRKMCLKPVLTQKYGMQSPLMYCRHSYWMELLLSSISDTELHKSQN